ncbi:MAG: replication-associated recombination protein A [Myxococcota bacterium]
MLFDESQIEPLHVKDAPLAERMRPKSLDEIVGQEHILGEGRQLNLALKNDELQSLILWGAPGSGKTTIARVIARTTKSHFIAISAVLAGVKELREAIDEAKKQRRLGKRTILFIDEIHRFNKSQQDGLLPFVEQGVVTLIGATTENPSFSIIPALLSRVQVLVLNGLAEDELVTLARRALSDRIRGLGALNLSAPHEVLIFLARKADGDARRALTTLDIAAKMALRKNSKEIKIEFVEEALLSKAIHYDKNGEEHYNVISAFIKSLRGSDPDAALYWMARMLEGGEDPLFIVRRMIIFAAEDIGVANPLALLLATSCHQAVHFIGLPEAVLPMSETVIYLATSPKSNTALSAYAKARDAAKEFGALPVPKHIRNAPTKLMKELGYAKGYKYPHNYDGNFTPDDYLPERLKGSIFYEPGINGKEEEIKKRLENWRNQRKPTAKPKNRSK